MALYNSKNTQIKIKKITVTISLTTVNIKMLKKISLPIVKNYKT